MWRKKRVGEWVEQEPVNVNVVSEWKLENMGVSEWVNESVGESMMLNENGFVEELDLVCQNLKNDNDFNKYTQNHNHKRNYSHRNDCRHNEPLWNECCTSEFSASGNFNTLCSNFSWHTMATKKGLQQPASCLTDLPSCQLDRWIASVRCKGKVDSTADLERWKFSHCSECLWCLCVDGILAVWRLNQLCWTGPRCSNLMFSLRIRFKPQCRNGKKGNLKKQLWS